MSRITARRIERYRSSAAAAGEAAGSLIFACQSVDYHGIDAAVAFAEDAGHFANLVIDLTAPQCVGFPDCDGDLIGEPHSQPCPLFGEPWL